MLKRFGIYLLLLGISNQSAFVYGQETVARLKSHPFHEEYTKEAPVSGRVIAGISFTGGSISKNISLLPPIFAAGGSVCVRVMSRDGLYWSKNTFELPSDISPQPIPLEYPSKYNDVIGTLKPEDLAILAYIGDCEISDSGPLILASRFDSTKPPTQIQIYINSARSDTYAIITNHLPEAKTTRCTQIKEGRRTGYDTICTINLAEVDNAISHLDIKIKRREHNRMLPATDLRVELPRP